MADNAVSELTSAIQSASINYHPDPTHDTNPSTAASQKTPVTLTSDASSSHLEHLEHHAHVRRRSSSVSSTTLSSLPSSPSRIRTHHHHHRHHHDTIPASDISPIPRRPALPPLPDMRFEQSYLASIKDCDTWYAVGWVTMKNQVMQPFLQGMLWSLCIFGWRAFNTETKFAGAGVGAKIRRWWWGVNNWKIPDASRQAAKAAEIKEFYQAEFASAAQD